MNTETWLQSIIAPLSTEPSVELQRFFTSCDTDVTTEVLRRANIILMTIFPNCGPDERSLQGGMMVNVWTEQRRLEAMKLYYNVLQTICTKETKTLQAKNLTPLLINDRFHRCLLSCSSELVLATNSSVPMMFPAVFERTGITAFDLIMVIEFFIEDEISLPRELKRHLNSLEEQFLESIVWKKGSSLYNILKVARPSLSGEIGRLGLEAEPMPSLDAIAMHMNMPYVSSVQRDETSPDHIEDLQSPKRLRRDGQSVLVERNSFSSPVRNLHLALKSMKPRNLSPDSQSIIPSSIRPSPCGREDICPDIAITVFFYKIERLAAVRINAMVERLQYPQQMSKPVYEFFKKILKETTSLFFNRHIDQIILCCLFGVAKILNLNPSFNEILSSYSKQPHCKPQVLSGVFIYEMSKRRVQRNGHNHMHIFNFYNHVFLPAAKPQLDDITTEGTAKTDGSGDEASKTSNLPCQLGQSPTSPKGTPFPSLPITSPKRVSAAHNVYVSPMRASKMETLISNSGGSHYAFVGETTQPYQSPSKDLNAINDYLKCTRNVRRALDFSSQFISDSLVDL